MYKNYEEILKNLARGENYIFTSNYFTEETEMWMVLNQISFKELPLYLNSFAALPREIGNSRQSGVWARGIALRIKNGGKPIRITLNQLKGRYDVETWEKEES